MNDKDVNLKVAQIKLEFVQTLINKLTQYRQEIINDKIVPSAIKNGNFQTKSGVISGVFYSINELFDERDNLEKQIAQMTA